MYYESVKFRFTQRDPRTSLTWKKFYLLSTIMACIFAIVASVYMWILFSYYAQDNAIGVFFLVVSLVSATFAVIMLCINFVAFFNEQFMWMIGVVGGVRCIGKDVEDCSPGILSQNAVNIQSQMDEMQDQFQIDLDEAIRQTRNY